MPTQFAVDYIVWVFFSALGVVQVACAISGLRGVLFVRGAPVRWTVVVGLALAVGMTTWYFLDEKRNQPDTGLGLDANAQARLFVISAGFAVALTFLVTSAINHRWGANSGWDPGSGDPPPEGFEWFRRTTFMRAILARVSYLRRHRREEASR